MNPNEKSDKPGKDSMGMDMVPFEVEEKPAVTPKGLADITITPEQRTRLGLTFGTVEMRDIVKGSDEPRRASFRMKQGCSRSQPR